MYPVLWVDALYEKVRVDARIVSRAVLIVCGVDENGHRNIIAVEPMAEESRSSYVRLVTTYLMEYAEDWSTSRVNIQRSCFSSYYCSSTAQLCGKLHSVFALIGYLCEIRINERIVIKRKTSYSMYGNDIIEN